MSLHVRRALLRMMLLVAACVGALAGSAVSGDAATTVTALRFGNPGDVPMAGDWNGSGRTQIGVYRPSNETFYLGDVNGAAQYTLFLGNAGDMPIAGDWNGLGRTQIGVYRPSDETFYLGDVNGAAQYTLFFGNAGDVPIAGDWFGSGRTQIGVYRPSNETFYLGDVNGRSVTSEMFGDLNDVPITGDWNNSGKTQIGVYRPSNQTFYLQEVAPSLVATTPVTTPLPTPAPGSRAHPHVSVKITMSWTWNRSRTQLRKLRLGRLPRGARLSVSCAGSGCPKRAQAARAGGSRALVHRLDGSVYRDGDRIRITISAPRHVSERVAVRIRYGKLPLAREL